MMTSNSQTSTETAIHYPESDGQPMAENTEQFRWIVMITENLEALFRHQPEVFVAGDLLWYPVEGHPEIRRAPDTLVVFGRPKGRRGAYLQWQEDGIAPHVVFEVLSPGNTLTEMLAKLEFYERYGVEEYYIYRHAARTRQTASAKHHGQLDQSTIGDPLRYQRLGTSHFYAGRRAFCQLQRFEAAVGK
jgi:Uma2 family endonuclease